MEILETLGSALGVIAIILIGVFYKSLHKYVDEKAKNLATLEDTKKITNEVEKVKTNYQQKSHAWKQLFEKEYLILQDVWNSTWELQAHAKYLRPKFDLLPEDKEEREEVFKKRYSEYSEAGKLFKDNVIKNRPFIPPHVYDACMALSQIVRKLQTDFEISFTYSSRANWEKNYSMFKRVGH